MAPPTTCTALRSGPMTARRGSMEGGSTKYSTCQGGHGRACRELLACVGPTYVINMLSEDLCFRHSNHSRR
jgi:hypothetical protein